jgi:hypothetical protein
VIDLASEVGSGTRFRITLPRAGSIAVEGPPANVNETSRGDHVARNAGTIG